MSISYGEINVITGMTDKELKAEYNELWELEFTDDSSQEANDDTINAILTEMESRGLPHP